MSATENTHDDHFGTVVVRERRYEVRIGGLVIEPDGCTLYSDFFVDAGADVPAVTVTG